MGKMYINSTIIYNKMNWFELENNKNIETRNYNGIGVKRKGKKKNAYVASEAIFMYFFQYPHIHMQI